MMMLRGSRRSCDWWTLYAVVHFIADRCPDGNWRRLHASARAMAVNIKIPSKILSGSKPNEATPIARFSDGRCFALAFYECLNYELLTCNILEWPS